MTRANLPLGVPDALAASGLRAGHLFRLIFPSLTLYATSMGVRVEYNGNVYLPDAIVIDWGGVVESSDLKARAVTFTLSSRPDIVEAVMNDNWTTAPADVWLAVFDEQFQVIGSPYPVARNLRMSESVIDDSADGSISLTCETGAIESIRDSLQIVSGPTQQLRYPGDTAFDRLTELRNKEVDWGGARQTAGISTDNPMGNTGSANGRNVYFPTGGNSGSRNPIFPGTGSNNPSGPYGGLNRRAP